VWALLVGYRRHGSQAGSARFLTVICGGTDMESPDVQEMVVIHRVFRRELTVIPRLVRSVPDGDAQRVRVVAEHAAFVLDFLHAHHSGEDELLWPLLLQRAAPSATLVRTMQEQHHGI